MGRCRKSHLVAAIQPAMLVGQKQGREDLHPLEARLTHLPRRFEQPASAGLAGIETVATGGA
jgi:hypothetical protein